ncbi:Uncharacterised protein [Mycobacteroides abscessus subsp. abscessus]|nr:Uncharacterised protein [Mycobacteroides abscessus subsp. abscessus]SIC82328.1 Uncharacterised protein [Mycobacteroides abscessus subsp. abscessus]SKP24311.1 Uncharacterised protein [Mycobacteroides abscessus subsp. abscessus]
MSNSTKRARGVGTIATRGSIRNAASSISSLVSTTVDGEAVEPTPAPAALTAVPESDPEAPEASESPEGGGALTGAGGEATEEEAVPNPEVASEDGSAPEVETTEQPEGSESHEVDNSAGPTSEKNPTSSSSAGRSGRPGAGNSKSGKSEPSPAGSDFAVPAGLLIPEPVKGTKQLGTRISTAVSDPFDEYYYKLKRHGYTQAKLLEFALTEMMQRYPAEQLIKSITGKK